jgi:hypothetical protein
MGRRLMLLGTHSNELVIKAIRIRLVYTLDLVPQTICARVIVIALDLAATAFLTRESWSSTATLLWLRLSLHEVTDYNISFSLSLFFGRIMYHSCSREKSCGRWVEDAENHCLRQVSAEAAFVHYVRLLEPLGRSTGAGYYYVPTV